MISAAISQIKSELPQGVNLVAVSKFHPLSAIQEAYLAGQRMFGENRPQEFAQKAQAMSQWCLENHCEPVQWHFIGHLQTNKLKMVLPYAHLVQSVDSIHLLEAISSWAKSAEKEISVLLELHLGAEQTKHGLSEDEIKDILAHSDHYPNVRFCGLMGMATNTADESVVEADFTRIEALMGNVSAMFPQLTDFRELSIGMSEDYRIALRHGATIIRIGTKLFGPREY